MDFSSMCRTCLGTKYLSPIFKEGDDHDDFSATVLITTGLQIQINDGLPQQMCKMCMKFLKDTVKFRHLCKKAEMQLLSIKNSQKYHEDALKDIVVEKSYHKRKISTEDSNKNTVFSIKIELDFENDDDIPLLQQKLNFTKHEIETGFVKHDIEQETDGDVEENEYQIQDEIIDNKKNDDTAQNSHSRFNFDSKMHKSRLEIDNQLMYNDDESKTNNEIENDNKTISETIQSETNKINDSKSETEFHFVSDPHKLLTMEMTEYSMETPKCRTRITNNDIEFSNYSVHNKINISDCNVSFPNHNIENSKINDKYQMYFAKVRKRKPKNKWNKNSLLISNLDLKVKENSQHDTENEVDFKIDAENLPIVIKDENKSHETVAESPPFIIKDENRVTCKLCQKDLSKRSIDSHIVNSHPGADTRRVKCELCDKYVLKKRLIRHKIVMHRQVDSFTCGYCKTIFDSKEMLIDHVSICTEKKRKRKIVTEKKKEVIVECDICNKSMQKSSLRMHKEIKHAGMGPVCEHCGRRFGNKNRLSEHLRAKHGYEKFKCSMCDFLSASSLALKNHERRHRGEKPYVCEQCGAKFHASHLLAQHKHSHRTEKNMKCDQCPAAFKANNTLHMHKMTCHNNNTYQCPMCPRTYNSRHYAVKHLRNVHRHTGAVGPLIMGPRDPSTGPQNVIRVVRVGSKEPDSKRYMNCTVTAGP